MCITTGRFMSCSAELSGKKGTNEANMEDRNENRK